MALLEIFLSPLYLGVIVWIRRDCIYPDSWVVSWQGNKWPDNQPYSDPSQRRNKNKKIITCFRQAYPAMSHVIKRDIFRKHRKVKGWDVRKEGKMKGGMRDRDKVSERVMETFQVRFLFVLQIGPFIQWFWSIEQIDDRWNTALTRVHNLIQLF